MGGCASLERVVLHPDQTGTRPQSGSQSESQSKPDSEHHEYGSAHCLDDRQVPERAEVGDQVTIAANVSDDETSTDNLTYQWSAPAGTLTGTGRTITWKAPTGTGAIGLHKVTLTVIETYGTVTEPREHRVTATSPNIHVEDSNAAIRALALQFLSDFTHPEIPADVCVRNFSDACRGKASEFTDITNNRKNLKIDPAKSAYSITSVTINPARTQATAIARCEFTSLVKEPGPWGKPGDITLAKGNCRLTAVYESQQWRLCESTFDATNTAGQYFIF